MQRTPRGLAELDGPLRSGDLSRRTSLETPVYQPGPSLLPESLHHSSLFLAHSKQKKRTMLESFATRLVEKYVAPYADVDPEQLRVAVLSGQVTLTDVKLKTSAFDALGFPLTVCSGRVGEVVIDVTWSALTAKPAKVHLRDVTIVIGPSGTDASADVRSSRLAVLQKEELQRDEEARMLRLVCMCSCVHVCMRDIFFGSAMDVCVSVPFALPFHPAYRLPV